MGSGRDGIAAVSHPSPSKSAMNGVETRDMDGAIVQVERDRVVYRASALGSCTKALIAARMGYEPIAPPRDTQVRMDEGHLHEMDVTRRMNEDGWSFVPASSQREIVVPVTGRLVVVGHCDGMAQAPVMGEAAIKVVEIKSQSKDEWASFELRSWDSGFFPKYKWQLSSYMWGAGSNGSFMPAVVVRKNRNSGEVKYEYVDEPFYTLAEIKVRVLMIEAAAKNQSLPESCDNRTFPCPYFYLHEDDKPEELEDETLGELARQYEEARITEASAKSRKEELRKVLRAGVNGLGPKTTADGTRINFYLANNPPFLNKERMKADGIEVDAYMEQGRSERLKITLPKETDAPN